jgi:AcrR family transcriptional regulator
VYDVSSDRGRRAPIWAEPQPGQRRPSVSREQIAATALAVADAGGLQLGVGTMTLYHYVRTKDDLFALMSDAIMGELLVEESELDAVDWRSSLGAVGRRSRDVFRRHPWMVRAMDQGNGGIGPNGMRHFEQSLAAVEGTGLDPAGKLEVIALVDDLVFGHAFRWSLEEEEMRSDDWQQRAEAYVEGMLATGEYPQIEALLGDGDRHATWERIMHEANHVDRFERGLEALLDGIERRLAG